MAMNCNSGDGWRACKEDVEAKGCLIHAQRMVLVVQEGSKMLPPVNLLTWLRKPGEHLKLRYLRWGRMQAPQGGTPSLHVGLFLSHTTCKGAEMRSICTQNWPTLNISAQLPLWAETAM
eukprot:scaffold119638_cov14-Tisochrysis_lutea.AAC.1